MASVTTSLHVQKPCTRLRTSSSARRGTRRAAPPHAAAAAADADGAVVLALDIGTTGTKAAAVTRSGLIRAVGTAGVFLQHTLHPHITAKKRLV